MRLVILCLAAPFAVVAATHSYPSTAPRNFQSFLEAKMRRMSYDVWEVKQKVADCCNKAGCTYSGKSYDHGSIFVADDDCNFCTCSYGSVDCTNKTSCGQSAAGSSYNYRDEIAQSYCSTLAISVSDPLHVSAVRRDCEDPAAPTCHAICDSGTDFATNITASFPSANIDEYNCVGALWFWNDHPILPPNPGPGQTGAGALNLVTISWNQATGCVATGCGPNYCCCEGHED